MVDIQDVDVCWVCLAPADSAQPIVQACQCPRKVHKECLARWQLQSVGKSEETECRFCYAKLPDWRAAYDLPLAAPVMTVTHNNVQYLLEVNPGESGRLEFQDNIRRIFGLGLQDVISLSFGCKAPGTDQHISLTGWQSYDAAVHCAAVAAGARQAHTKLRQDQARSPQPVQPHSPAGMYHGSDSSESATSTAWSASSPRHHWLSTTSIASSVPQGIARDSLLLQNASKQRSSPANTSLIPSLMDSLRAGAKPPRRRN